MPDIAERPVLVGVDGSAESVAALAMAAGEAHLRRARLVVTYAWAGPPWRPGRRPVGCASRAEAERLLAAATAWLRAHHPHLPVTGRLVLGDPVEVLAAGSVGAQLVVVGHRGTGLTRRGWGSVATQLSRRSRAPLIVRPFHGSAAEPDRAAPVVVAVSAEPSDRTLRFAFEEAHRHGVPLTPCYVSPPGPTSAPDAEPVGPGETLSAALSDWSARFPDVTVRPEVRQGRDVAQTLAEAARQARLLVVGAGAGLPVIELLLGSVPRGLRRSAACPVAIVPEPGSAAPDARPTAGKAAADNPPAGPVAAPGPGAARRYRQLERAV